MTNIKAKDYDEDAVYLKASGAGSPADPHIPVHSIEGLTLVDGNVPVSGKAKDDGPSWTSSRLKGYSADATSIALDITGAPTTDQKIVITDLYIWITTPSCVVSIFEESNATSIIDIPMPVNGREVMVPRSALKNATANKKFQIKTSVAVPIYTFCLYRSEE